jgi:hypothetical protein
MFFFRNVLKPTGGLDVLLWLREACLAAGMRTQTTSCYAQEHYERVLLGFGLNNRLNHINLNNLSTKCDVIKKATITIIEYDRRKENNKCNDKCR